MSLTAVTDTDHDIGFTVDGHPCTCTRPTDDQVVVLQGLLDTATDYARLTAGIMTWLTDVLDADCHRHLTGRLADPADPFDRVALQDILKWLMLAWTPPPPPVLALVTGA